MGNGDSEQNVRIKLLGPGKGVSLLINSSIMMNECETLRHVYANPHANMASMRMCVCGYVCAGGKLKDAHVY